MAKLNVVIPAVNVKVDGVEYRKVERAAKAGDIVRITDEDAKDNEYLTFNAFYKVDRIDVCNDPQITDDDGDELDLCNWTYEVYEKAAEEKRRLTVGDYARVTGNLNAHNYEVGSVVKITFDDEKYAPYKAEKSDGSTGNWLREDNVEPATEAEFLAQKKTEVTAVKHEFKVGDKVRSRSGFLRTLKERDPRNDGRYGKAWRTVEGIGWLGEDQFELLEAAATTAPSDEIVHEGVRYRKVARKANVGELVVIVDAHPYGGKYANGDILTARKPFMGDWVYLGDIDYATIQSEYNVLEPVTAVSEPQASRLKVGEYAKAVKALGRFRSEGDIVKITKDDGSRSPFNTEHLDGRYGGWGRPETLVRATDEEVAAAKRALDPRSKFAVGDKVRLVGGGGASGLNGFNNGQVYDVSDPFTTFWSGKRVKITGGDAYQGFALPDQLVKVTAEEIAEGERKSAEEAKWAAIGRKVGEFKMGDIVKVISGSTGGHQDGTHGELVSGAHFPFPREFGVKANGKVKDHTSSGFTLIVPVEQRFDTPASA